MLPKEMEGNFDVLIGVNSEAWRSKAEEKEGADDRAGGLHHSGEGPKAGMGFVMDGRASTTALTLLKGWYTSLQRPSHEGAGERLLSGGLDWPGCPV